MATKQKSKPKAATPQLSPAEAARQKQARKVAHRVVERSRRAIKEPHRADVAPGWWQGLKADVTTAILAGC